jgi:hypothetical protein
LPRPHTLPRQGQGHNQTARGHAVALKADLFDKRLKFRHVIPGDAKSARLKHTCQKSSFYRYFATLPEIPTGNFSRKGRLLTVSYV